MTRLSLAVTELGGAAAGVWFVPHSEYAAQTMKLLGPTIIDENFPMDHTHTAPYLADIVSQNSSSFALLQTPPQKYPRPIYIISPFYPSKAEQI